jgi:hypothetical protein
VTGKKVVALNWRQELNLSAPTQLHDRLVDEVVRRAGDCTTNGGSDDQERDAR